MAIFKLLRVCCYEFINIPFSEEEFEMLYTGNDIAVSQINSQQPLFHIQELYMRKLLNITDPKRIWTFHKMFQYKMYKLRYFFRGVFYCTYQGKYIQDVWKITTTERKSMRLNMASNLYLDVKGEVGIKREEEKQMAKGKKPEKEEQESDRQNCRE